MTEARACKDQHVVVIGGANSAGQAAVYFSQYAGRVTVLARSPLEKSMSHYLIEQLATRANVVVRTGAVAIAAEGENGRLRALRIRDAANGEGVEAVDACFVFIGAAPRTEWLEGVVARDERGFILAGADAKAAGWPLRRDPYLLETTVPGVFVAGDVRARSIKRVASAVGEGSMAVSLVHQYLSDT
jgi:thioredoxin reductase (NADPH)